MERWAGKVALVTGASAGIGAAIATELVKHGLQVVGLARRLDRLEKLGAKLADQPGKFHPIKGDVTDEHDVIAAFKWITEFLGGIDILINNAGCVRNTTLCDGQVNDWKVVLDTNILGMCICTREAVRSMTQHGVAGHIIQINSVLGHHIPSRFGPFTHVYGGSKYAVTGITQTLRLELAAKKSPIKVTSISPGYVRETEIVEAGGQDDGTIPWQDMVSILPADIVQGVVYALSTPPTVQVSELTITPLLQNL